MRTLSAQNLALYLGCDCEVNAPREKIFEGQLQEIGLPDYCIVHSVVRTHTTVNGLINDELSTRVAESLPAGIWGD